MVSKSTGRRPQGFTLIEVLAVFGMISLVIVILAPALQVARDRARMVRCKNNMKQMGLALHNYHDTYVLFPPGYIAATKIGKDDSIELAWSSGWGWQTSVLPYIDQAPLYNQIDFNAGLPTAVEKTASTKIAAYTCPEDNGTRIVAKVALLGPFPGGRESAVVEKGYGRSNYVGVAGWDNDWHLGSKAPENPNAAADKMASNWTKQEVGHDFRDGIVIYTHDFKLKSNKPIPNARNFRGLFGENSSRGMRSVTDGTSNTIVVGERATPTKNASEKDVGNAIWAGVPDRSTRVGQSSALGSAYWLINHELTKEEVPNTTGFSSRHGDGAHFLFGDGSVRFVAEKMDLSMLRRLSMIDDGLVLEGIPVPVLP